VDLAGHRRRYQDVARQLAPYVAAGDDAQEIPAGALEALSAGGCFGCSLPTGYGGSGHGLRVFAVQQEELAAVWPAAAVACTWTNLSGRLIARFGSEQQRADLLPGLAAGSLLGAVAWTEPKGGSDATVLDTTARRQPGGWRLDGAKRLIDNVGRASFFIVGARSHEDVNPHRALSMFVVPGRHPGLVDRGVYDLLGLRGTGVGWFRLDRCEVSDDQVLGQAGRGFYQMMDMVEFGRTGVAAMCLGICEAALGQVAAFLPGRRAFGQPLSGNDVVLAKVADLRVKTDAARLLMDRSAAMVDAGIRAATESAMAKLFASELAVELTAATLHLHGGIGATTQTPQARLVRDSHAFTIGEGTSEVLRKIIGRAEIARAANTSSTK